VVEELLHRIYSFQAGRAASDNHTLTALRDWRRLIHEIRKIMSRNFFLNCGKQDGFLHGRTPGGVQRNGIKV